MGWAFSLCFLLLFYEWNSIALHVNYRRLGLGFSRNTKRCREKNLQIQIFNLSVMKPIYLSGQLWLRYGITVWPGHYAVVSSFGLDKVIPFSGAIRNSLWGWCIPACICCAWTISIATPSSAIPNENISSKRPFQGERHHSYRKRLYLMFTFLSPFQGDT